MKPANIDFDAELGRGLPSYSDVLGRWWLNQSSDDAHQRAYRNVARYIHASFQRELRLVVDYGCGPGHLLSRLAWRYPAARFVGLDGSAHMLDCARRRIARQGRAFAVRIRLVQTPLPHFTGGRLAADLVVFAFPNIVPVRPDGDFRFAEAQMSAAELRILQLLARRSRRNPQSRYGAMLRDRAISLHMRRLLRTGGACVRVEYGDCRREEMSRSQMLRTMMEEGSLDGDVEGYTPRTWFRVVASSYFRSRVIRDVAHQEGAQPRGGGYLISILRAV